MELGLRGRVALVAAASQGLGKAIALGLAKEGARVAICARSAGGLEAAAAEIREATGAEVLARTADVTVEADVKALAGAVLDRWGRVDICVTNAGGPPSKSFAETTVEEWRAAVDLNLMSTVLLAREVLPHMAKQQWGRLITITSITVKQPVEGLILSNAVRTAVTGLVKSLSNEYARHGVLVNNVCPGYTLTARLDELSARLAAAENVAAERIVERWASQTAMRRLGRPEELANLVVFLASERASYITGESIAVDGGFVKGL